MFGTFRKHSTWLWGIIIAATVVSLVVWTGNRGNSHDARGPADYGNIAGKRVTVDEYTHAMHEARLEYFFNHQEWPKEGEAERTGFNLNRETYIRLFYITKINEMGIHISDDEVSRVAAQNLKSMTKPGSGTIPMETFAEQILSPGGLTIADYERFLRHMIGRQQLVAAVSVGSQLVTTKDARSIYERENQEISAQAVFFSASNYLSIITASPAELSEFYSNRVAQYRLPERIQVSYVEFKATNYNADATAEMAKLTNITAIIDNVYQRRGGTNYYKELTPEKAKETIHSEMFQELALRAARNQASKFVAPLLEPGMKADSLAAAAKNDGRAIKLTSVFDSTTGPVELNVSETFVRAAFELRDDEPILGPLIAREAVYVIAKSRQYPSEIPSFDAIREKVIADYKMFRAATTARAAAVAFVQGATNMSDKPFATLCAAAGANPVLLSAFSMNSTAIPEVEPYLGVQDFKNIALRTPVGKVNGMPAYTGGGALYVMSKLPLDEKKTAEELPKFTLMLRQARQEEFFRRWFESEAGKVLSDTPIVRRQAQLDASGRN